MRVGAFLVALLLAMPTCAAAQEWELYVSRQDGFSINFPGTPQITETKWQSQLNYTLPARVYKADRGQERYSVTVVDYSSLEQQGIARWTQCPPGNAQCRDGGDTIGPGYWKQDERGALVYAASKYLRPPFEVTYYAWDWQDMVEGTSLQLKSPNGRRTLTNVSCTSSRAPCQRATRSPVSFSSRSVGSTRMETASGTQRPCIQIRITVSACIRDRRTG
jgi:hypothetical protein